MNGMNCSGFTSVQGDNPSLWYSLAKLGVIQVTRIPIEFRYSMELLMNVACLCTRYVSTFLMNPHKECHFHSISPFYYPAKFGITRRRGTTGAALQQVASHSVTFYKQLYYIFQRNTSDLPRFTEIPKGC